jgi:iron-sulfur cluster assembly accessory protein
MALNVTITPAAEKFMRRIVRMSGLSGGAGFRLLVTAGGCSGYSSTFSAESAPQAGEEVVTPLDGLNLFLPAESRLLLEGVTIDFVDTPTQSGLTFFNPNQAACGCSSAEASGPVETRISIGAIGRGRPPAMAKPN